MAQAKPDAGAIQKAFSIIYKDWRGKKRSKVRCASPSSDQSYWSEAAQLRRTLPCNHCKGSLLSLQLCQATLSVVAALLTCYALLDKVTFLYLTITNQPQPQPQRN